MITLIYWQSKELMRREFEGIQDALDVAVGMMPSEVGGLGEGLPDHIEDSATGSTIMDNAGLMEYVDRVWDPPSCAVD